MQVTDCSVDVCSHTNTECQDVFHWFYSVWSNSVRSQRQVVWGGLDRTGPDHETSESVCEATDLVWMETFQIDCCEVLRRNLTLNISLSVSVSSHCQNFRSRSEPPDRSAHKQRFMCVCLHSAVLFSAHIDAEGTHTSSESAGR